MNSSQHTLKACASCGKTNLDCGSNAAAFAISKLLAKCLLDLSSSTAKAEAELPHSKLGFAVEDEVGESLEGAGVLGEAGAVEAGFGADGVFEGEVAGAIEGAGIADEGD